MTDALVDVVADAIILSGSNGICRLGAVCELCDCFADVDGGATRDELARRYAAMAIAYQKRVPRG